MRRSCSVAAGDKPGFRINASISRAVYQAVTTMERKTGGGKTSSMEAFLEERAQQLFLLSDQERKGFIVKRDMQRMRAEIPLTPEQLEAVFDSLDVNNNGYLTIEQFLSGFGEFIASHSNRAWELEEVMESSQQDVPEEPLQSILQELQSIKVLNSIDILRQLCHHVVREDTSNIQNNLESFLVQLTTDLRRCQEEQRSLEEARRLKDDEHESHVRRLFEEMESQLHEEKKIKTRQEEQRLRLKHNSLEQDLEEKEQHLQKALRRQQELADRVQDLRSKEQQLKDENERLQNSKKELQSELETEHREVAQLQHFLADVRQNEAWEKRKHLSAGFRLAQKIMLEQQGLTQQLRLLQEMTSTLEREDGEQKDTNKSSQDLAEEDFNPMDFQSHGIKPWKKHFFNHSIEDDYEGTELLTSQKREDAGSYQHIPTTVS